ncbi:MxaH protein [Methylosinus sp. Sm6]|uniref:MxaH protein n=1 Tax=Methylosinus sp. Sm6 TaxID=2866948 RepID=UPI001C9909FA|nr:MxaH protein [Methylosinus sp. Sm6]MBY6240855.1 MxaH protein [Methylosinus sp. Sm6]
MAAIAFIASTGAVRMRPLRIAVALGCVALCACDDGRSKGEAPSSDAVRVEDKTPGAWLRRDEADPAVWLASKEQGRAATPDDARVATLKKALARADFSFLETERMVANRTAQLAEMLAREGMSEDYATIIEELAAVVDAKKGKATYGELCGYYFSLRRGGASRAETLRILKERFGPSEQ